MGGRVGTVGGRPGPHHSISGVCRLHDGGRPAVLLGTRWARELDII